MDPGAVLPSQCLPFSLDTLEGKIKVCTGIQKAEDTQSNTHLYTQWQPPSKLTNQPASQN